jgi:hypothetical protein
MNCGNRTSFVTPRQEYRSQDFWEYGAEENLSREWIMETIE